MARKNAKGTRDGDAINTTTHSIRGDSKVPLEERTDVLTEEEQDQILNELMMQNEQDIAFFTRFLNLPAVAILLVQLYSAYSIVVSKTRDLTPRIPLLGVAISSNYPLVSTEIAVLSVQLALYELGDRPLTQTMVGMVAVLVLAGLTNAVAALANGVIEFLWWLVPTADLLITTYAKWTMLKSRQDIQELAEKKYQNKSA
ncbi:hypothetical protein EV182_001660 [Spiromyces aspiralis]|uniref:Uncharacterized protein n=1 Tax=Spiromyces aspiralis TaxID=68401 RepID=A0ACC1HIT9_9FUNG|nr:hypothetical protein EV182_001660 [Spiromyces aspiralis]